MSASDAEYQPIWDPEAAGTVEVGVDIIEVDRIAHVLNRHGERFLRRCFSPKEQERYGKRIPELAARFAAKEATMKALGTGIRGVRWRDIEVMPNRRGKPIVQLYDTALARANKLGFVHIGISLTHSRTDAMAVVVAYKRPEAGG